MLSQLRNSVLVKFLWGFLALNFFNLSIDTKDINPEFIPENLSINDQESLLEVIAEQILGIENAFQEFDEPDQNDITKKTLTDIELFANKTLNLSLSLTAIEHQNNNFGYLDKFSLGESQLFSPPPEI